MSWPLTTYKLNSVYVPQMGDVVLYSKAGHHKYEQQMVTKGCLRNFPEVSAWKDWKLKPIECAKIVDLKYEKTTSNIFCILQLQVLYGRKSDFEVKYCNIDAPDFLVLKQLFERTSDFEWKNGHRFRCPIEDKWWHGKILKVLDYQEEISPFTRYEVQWDSE